MHKVTKIATTLTGSIHSPSLVPGAATPLRYFSQSTQHGNKEKKPGLMTFFARFKDVFKPTTMFPEEAAIHRGPSYRWVNFETIEEVYKYIGEGLKSNCRKNESPQNFSIAKYVHTNERSPWFGGCHTLEHMHNFAEKQDGKGFIIVFAPTSEADPRQKLLVNIAYANETGEANPHGDEQEVIHTGGDYKDLVQYIIQAKDFMHALKGQEVYCHLNKENVNLQSWHQEQLPRPITAFKL